MSERGSPSKLERGRVVFDRVVKHYPRDHRGSSARAALPWTRDLAGPEPFVAVEGISLDLPPGEALGIIGPNGAGKSTLLKMLAGVVVPTSGTVGHGGRLGQMIELGFGFHPELTGRENVWCNATMLGLTKRETRERLPAIVEFAGIGDALGTPLKRYSTGMRARLGFALATQLEADVLVVDEILAVGDREFQDRCIERMLEMLDAGTTLLYVSHDMGGVASMCKQVVVLDEGRVVDRGPAGEVIERYLSDRPQDLPTPSDRPIRIASLEPVEVNLEAFDAAHMRAVIEVTGPIGQIDVRVELTCPTYAPDAILGHSTDPLPPALAEPGRHVVEASTSPLPILGAQIRVAILLVDRARHQLLDHAYVEYRCGVARTLTGRPRFPGSAHWMMQPADPAERFTLHGPRKPTSPVNGPKAVVTEGLGKRYASGRSRTNLRSAVPGSRFAPSAGDLVALDDVTLRIGVGESVGIIGPNGAGKSTLLKVLAGVVSPTTGSFETWGRLAAVLELGVGFHAEYTGAENLVQSATILGLMSSQIEERFDEIVAFAGIADAIDRPVKRYSTGMRARLGLAVALHVGADVLFIDEALSVGDHHFRRQVYQRIQEQRAAGLTFLFVSHNLKLVDMLCDRTLRFEHGRVVDDGRSAEVIERSGGMGWSGGSTDGSLGIRFHDLSLEHSELAVGDALHFQGWVEVTDPCPTVRIEVAYRVSVEDRAMADPEALNLMVTTVEPAGGPLCTPGWYSFTGSVDRNLLNGSLDLIVAAVETTDGTRIAEAWRPFVVGRTNDVSIAGTDRPSVSSAVSLTWGAPVDG